jgi:ATP-dependent RNA helicase RhlE
VGRGKKKPLLAHIIEAHSWSQVLVFTRTKFGANNVAEFLNKHGITAMALHGNKSQTARTQALAGFKSGDIRALVATDIAARGIDIDELPHVVNYDIPNISEDYVHRIGRTGRAGATGEAVSLVSLDEQGFMRDIERFTGQAVPVQAIDGFGPEENEVAEPIAMGRQTLWGGLGQPPSRDVMAAAAKAARSEMMQRMRDNKAGQGPRATPRPNGQVRTPGAKPPRPNGGQGQGRNRYRDDRPPRDPMMVRDAPHSQPSHHAPGEGGGEPDDFQPRANAHLGTQSGVNAFGHKNQNSAMRQPDPTRTSVDLMTERNRGGGQRNNSGRPGGPRKGGFGGGGGGGGRSGGGGGGGRGGGFPR